MTSTDIMDPLRKKTLQKSRRKQLLRARLVKSSVRQRRKKGHPHDTSSSEGHEGEGSPGLTEAPRPPSHTSPSSRMKERDSNSEQIYTETSEPPLTKRAASSSLSREASVKALLALSSSESSSSEDELPPLKPNPAKPLGFKIGSKSSVKSKAHPGTVTTSGESSHLRPAQKTKKFSKGAEIKSCKKGKVRPSHVTKAETPSGHKEPITRSNDSKRKRYILFVGNLPYAASREDVVGHFEHRGVSVMDVRLQTSKDTGKSRGFCFVELGSSTALSNALRLHHSKMVCGGEGGKRINVEVTCGGGGKGETRRRKIQEKNAKVQRQKRTRRGKGKMRGKEMRIM